MSKAQHYFPKIIGTIHKSLIYYWLEPVTFLYYLTNVFNNAQKKTKRLNQAYIIQRTSLLTSHGFEKVSSYLFITGTYEVADEEGD